MFGMGMGEIILIAVVALLVLGPERLPGAAKAIGKGIRDLRSQTKNLQDTIEQDTQIGDAVREIRGALRGDPETLYKRVTGEDFSLKEPTDQSHKGDKAAVGDKSDDEHEAGEGPEDSETTPPADGDDDSSAGESPENFKFAKAPPPPVPPKSKKVDPDLPLIRTPAGTLARGDEPGDDESGDEPNHGDEPSHG